jgi:DNA-binding IclR family transcriptional regulator
MGRIDYIHASMPATTSSNPSVAPASAAAARTPRRGPQGTAALGKTMEVLDLVGLAAQPPSFTELAKASGLPRATLHRLLAALIDHRMVEVSAADGRYVPGMHLLELARRTWEQADLRRAAAEAIAELGRRSGETVHLATLSDDSVVYIDKVECDYPVRLHSSIGKRGPVHSTAVGKVMAAWLSPTEQRALVARLDLQRYTEHTLVTQKALLAALARIREDGVAYDREEHVLGMHCVAAPVFDFRGRCVGGISVTAPLSRVDAAQLEVCAQWVRAAAGDTARRLGGEPRPAVA